MAKIRAGHMSGLSRWSGLRLRMTISYALTTLVAVLLTEVLITTALWTLLTRTRYAEQWAAIGTQQAANLYALAAAAQSGGDTLDPRTTFQPGQAASIVLPREYFSNSSIPTILSQPSPGATAAFALLITPDQRVLASSDPARVPVEANVTTLPLSEVELVRNALSGTPGNTTDTTANGRFSAAAAPVLGKEKNIIGAIYVQIPAVPTLGGIPILGLAEFLLGTGTFWLLIVLPAGILFGALTTRGLVRRIRRLASATERFAGGDYRQRVPITQRDEVGQLEMHFNQMAQQLLESIAQRQALAEQSARREERARIEQELRTAEQIQQALLPKEVPTLPGWHFAPYYRPAKQVGGDLYDFIPLNDGRLGIVVGDATGKGVPAALVMAMTLTMMRAVAHATGAPGQALARVNDLLAAEIAPGMFVTCFFALLDLNSGQLRYANAGHDLPYHQCADGVAELRATGMPLGIMPGMRYEERSVTLAPNDSVLFYSDGLVEAHDPQREMFGFPRLKALLAERAADDSLIGFLLDHLRAFTGDTWEQEDDVTMVTIRRIPDSSTHRLLAELALPTAPGNERLAMERVTQAAVPLGLSPAQMENLRTGVAEAVMNAMEHGNHYQPEKVVQVQVMATDDAILVQIRDQGADPIPDAIALPDLDAKLAGQQAPRGWGLFLIRNMVDQVHIAREQDHNLVELVIYRKHAEG